MNATTRSQNFCYAKLPQLSQTGDWIFHETPSPDEEPDPKKRECGCTCDGLECFHCERGKLGGTPNKPTCTVEAGCQDGEDEMPGGKCKKKEQTVIENPCDAFQPAGRLEGSECVVESDCPEPLSRSSLLFTNTGSCSCRYTVSCPPRASEGWEFKMQEIVDNKVVCMYEMIVPKADPIVTPATCAEGVLVAGECKVDIDCPPGPVQLSQQALACGPKTEEFMGRMFQELETIAESTFDKPLQMSCKTNCASVWAKLAECASHAAVDTSPNKVESWNACIGSTATKGVQQIDFSELLQPDMSHKMYWRFKSKREHLHCNSAFASAMNFGGSTWTELAKNAQALAVKNYVRLQGSFVDKPTRRISCRDGYCSAADKRGTSLGQCLSDCERWYPNK